MTFVKFIPWYISDNGNWPNGIIEPSEKKEELLNKNHKFIIPIDDIEKYANTHSISKEEAKDILQKQNNKEPIWTNQKMADYWDSIIEECDNEVKRYIIENKIFFTDNEHQSETFEGVPVCEDTDGNKYASTWSLRSWSNLMAECWNKILGIDSLDYIDIYCGNQPTEIVTYLKENNLANKDKWHKVI